MNGEHSEHPELLCLNYAPIPEAIFCGEHEVYACREAICYEDNKNNCEKCDVFLHQIKISEGDNDAEKAILGALSSLQSETFTPYSVLRRGRKELSELSMDEVKEGFNDLDEIGVINPTEEVDGVGRKYYEFSSKFKIVK